MVASKDLRYRITRYTYPAQPRYETSQLIALQLGDDEHYLVNIECKGVMARDDGVPAVSAGNSQLSGFSNAL